MAKAIVKKEENLPATYEEGDTWGTEGITSDDLHVSQIRVAQPQSEAVADGFVKLGQIHDSVNTDKILGDEKTPVEVIVFGTFKKIWKFVNGEYDSTEEFYPKYPYEEIDEKNDKITRSLYMGFYCILPEDVKTGAPFPYVLPFKGTGIKNGRILATMLKQLQALKKPSAANVITISLKKEKNDKGTWFSANPKMGRASTQGEMNAAYQWYKALAEQKVTITSDDEVMDAESDTIVPSATKDVGPSAPAEQQV